MAVWAIRLSSRAPKLYWVLTAGHIQTIGDVTRRLNSRSGAVLPQILIRVSGSSARFLSERSITVDIWSLQRKLPVAPRRTVRCRKTRTANSQIGSELCLMVNFRPRSSTGFRLITWRSFAFGQTENEPACPGRLPC